MIPSILVGVVALIIYIACFIRLFSNHGFNPQYTWVDALALFGIFAVYAIVFAGQGLEWWNLL